MEHIEIELENNLAVVRVPLTEETLERATIRDIFLFVCQHAHVEIPDEVFYAMLGDALAGTGTTVEGRTLERLEHKVEQLGHERDALLEMTMMLDEHPEDYEGPCACKLCQSYGDL